MKIISTYLGEIEMDTSKIITFPAGIPGFADAKRFVLLELPDNPVFHILQSVEDEELAFIITDPYYFYKDYSFELDKTVLETLNIKDRQDIVVYTILTAKQPFASSTINLKAPVVIHMKENLAKQVVLQTENYSSKARIDQPFHEGKEK